MLKRAVSLLLYLKSKVRNLSKPNEDMRVAISNKEPHCSMIIEITTKKPLTMFDC